MTTDAALSARVVALAAERGLRIAVAESLTGGLLTAAIVATSGASRVLSGGVVAYDTAIKRSVLGVDAALLAERGAVDPEVARRMADGVRVALAVDGRPADLGVATTGVAGPDPQDGKPVGLVYVGIAVGERVTAVELRLDGGRDGIRSAVVSAALARLAEALESA
ncbi:nicotinamide-nucleotide amidohydrolase family protein [Galbitalea sp. SE-J8]|uniref:CinA family protein n=1 Tax=Galbitalea sp. SE-J8 TaxID=3054952 RepID=UPI00259CF54D|nr:nicotinamide-nucleotide amidohydrolase family protein [Galbitalea sp. SE-J8]MDM4762557.1 nicotinamide-nucleotide amidohydrolase family protein [Galbitalea sp. SE-J8]